MLIPEITHMEALQRGLRVMDATALTLCMENRLPIHVFNMDDEQNIERIVSGERVGTLVKPEAGIMSELIDELLADAGERMSEAVEAAQNEFSSVRTGRASPSVLDRIMVDYYGATTPLKQLATINVPEARLLTVQPYDEASIKLIEKAIMESDIGLTPSNDGRIIRLSIPELNEERRRELVKVVRHLAEEGRISIRNIRRDIMHDLRELKDDGDVGADDEHRGERQAAEAHRRAHRRARTRCSRPRKQRSSRSERRWRRRPAPGRSTSPSSPTATAAGRKQRGLPVVEGHQAGADVVKARLRDAVEFGMRELTVYSFSTENWSRPAEEVTALMRMFSQRILSETPELKDEGVRMRFIGRRDRVAGALLEQMDWAEAETAANDRITLYVAFNYGGRAEIVDAAARYSGGGEEDVPGAALRARRCTIPTSSSAPAASSG